MNKKKLPHHLPETSSLEDPTLPSLADAKALRMRAQARLDKQTLHQANSPPETLPHSVHHLVHELQVHQIELEMQNDELRQSHLALDTARERYFDLYDLAPVGYVTLNASGLIVEANLTVATMLGATRSALVGQPLDPFVAKEDQDSFYLLRSQLMETGAPQSRDLRMADRAGLELWVHVMATVTTTTAGALELRMVLSDITPLKTLQGKLDRLAHFDALTNLPNRLLMTDRLQQAMAQARRTGQRLAVVYIDLDGFKAINDEYGHAAGDQMLIAVAAQMKQVLREGDTLARMGGDEFVAVLLNMGDIKVCAPLLDRMLGGAAMPMAFNDHLLNVSASMGVTFYPQAQEVEGDQLTRQADQAMYQAKRGGKNCWREFDTEVEASLRDWHQDLYRIQQALHDHELVMYYQPKVNIRTGQVVGAEALIRWWHPEKGLLLPLNFLPVVKDHELAIEIGEWVTDTALGQIESWQALGLHMPVSINVGARQLQQADFVLRLRAQLARHPGVDPADLTLEILETSALMDLPYASKVIEECHQMGVAFALDDFGTGYSSLTYLKRLRVATLKIDQSFVCDMLGNADGLAILKGIIDLATAFKRGVIAEGVESVAQGTQLLELGCDLAQGYCLARPMPARDFPAWVSHWTADWQAKTASEFSLTS